MLKIWGRNTSANVQKVMWALAELGVPSERIDVGGAFGRTQDDFYLKMNPNSLVPSLEEEDGFTMWESNAIVRYLSDKHGGALKISDVQTRARANMWMDWQLSVMMPAITPMFWQIYRTPADKRDDSVIAAGREKAIAGAKIMDAQLGRTAYLAGDTFTYGDIPCGVMIYRFTEMVKDHPDMPNLKRWYAAVSGREAFKKEVGSVPLS